MRYRQNVLDLTNKIFLGAESLIKSAIRMLHHLNDPFFKSWVLFTEGHTIKS